MNEIHLYPDFSSSYRPFVLLTHYFPLSLAVETQSQLADIHGVFRGWPQEATDNNRRIVQAQVKDHLLTTAGPSTHSSSISNETKATQDSKAAAASGQAHLISTRTGSRRP